MKNKWTRHPIWSSVIATLISTFLIWIGTSIYQSSINSKVDDSFLHAHISLPVWGFVLLFFFIFLISAYVNKRLNIDFNVLVPNNDVEIVRSNSEKFTAKNGRHRLIDANILNLKNGSFCVWAYSAEMHNKHCDPPKNLYLLSHDTNDGVPEKKDGGIYYPNTWAIIVTPPHNGATAPNWNFCVNNGRDDNLRIEHRHKLSVGWHLFTVSWSSTSDYIRFYIDKYLIAEKTFVNNWPSNTSKNIYIGTWPNREPCHYFNSEIGPYRVSKGELDERSLFKYFDSTKPS